jgi:ribose/xylose/arabinose/galactoside ABC-type transport system permease subunit
MNESMMSTTATAEETFVSRESRLATVRHRVNAQVLGVYLALALSWIALSIASPYFLTVDNIRNVFVSASTLALIGAGLTMVMIAGEIDLSVGAMQAFAGSIAAEFIITQGLPWPLGIVLALAFGTVAGAISGIVAVIGRLDTFITTLAMLGIAQGTGFLLTGGQPLNGFPKHYSVIGNGLVGPVPVAVIIMVVAYVVLHVVLTQTEFGLRIFAVGGNRSAAVRVGIPSGRIVVAVLALSGFLAAVAGIILTSRLDAGSGDYGGADLLPAIAGVIIGGTSLRGGVGSLAGTFAGVLIVATINNGLTILNVQQFWQQVVVGIIIMCAVLIDQAAKGYISVGGGLRGRPGRPREGR